MATTNLNQKFYSLSPPNFLKSIVAGMCISFGCICSLSTDNKIWGTLLFTVGLFSIITYQLNLFTGKIGLVHSWTEVLNCFVYLFGNMIGCIIMFNLIRFTSIYNKILPVLQTTALNRMNQTQLELFILGILCGILMLFATKNTSNKILTMFCVCTFITIGSAHSVADSFFLLAYNNPLEYIKDILTIACGNAVGSIIINRMIELK